RNAQHARQRLEQRPADAAAAGQIAADETREFAAAAMAQLDEIRIAGTVPDDERFGLQRRNAHVAAHQVPVVLRDQDEVAGNDVERVAAVGQTYLAGTLG